MATVKKMAKAQSGKATPDSTDFFEKRADRYDKAASRLIRAGGYESVLRMKKVADQAKDDAWRQGFKGKPGYDANGFPSKKKAASKLPMKKAQDGDQLRKGQYKRIGRIAEKNPERADRVAERMNRKADRVERGKDIASPRRSLMMDMRRSEMEMDNRKYKLDSGPIKPKMQNGGSKSKGFPDLNKDGKITKADILKGRGVIAKKGAMIKKAGKAIVAKKIVKSIKKK